MKTERAKIVTRQLRKLEEKTGQDINRLRSTLALERLLARITIDQELAKHLIFKGGFVMFKVYESKRYTRDIDALAQNIEIKKIESQVLNALNTDISDGFWFGDSTVEELFHQGEYCGLRFDVAFQIGEPNHKKLHKLPRVHFDVGIGDSIGNSPIETKLTPLIDIGEEITWKIYPPEFIYSEKLETLVFRGSLNSRAKDFYDLVVLFSRCSLEKLVSAIKITFNTRKTKIPRSFSEYLESLNFTSIKPAWKAQGFGDFEQAMNRLNKDFAVIDKLISSAQSKIERLT